MKLRVFTGLSVLDKTGRSRFLLETRTQLLALMLFLALMLLLASTPCAAQRALTPLVRVVDVNVGASAQVELHDGSTARLQLLDIRTKRDSVTRALREARVTVEVNGEQVTLYSGNYHLPVSVAGVQVDCPAVYKYMKDSRSNAWGLRKDARLRLWPEGSPWIRPGTFVYPVRQRWFASDTQMANEPAFVNGGDRPSRRGQVYYHSGLDIGGAEDLVEIVAATDGVVVSAEGEVLDGAAQPPVNPRYDVVYIRDPRGWYYRYAHLASMVVEVGQRVQAGEPVGLMGKEGASGGYAHLHFEIKCRQPSGKWGTQEGYAFLWQAYQQEYDPLVIAAARPHHIVLPGEAVSLEARKSWAKGTIESYTWTLHDGTTTHGSAARQRYDEQGTYSEIVKITDDRGHVDYDFTVVQVVDTSQSTTLPPTIHAAFYPTFDIEAGEEITFQVRTFRIAPNEGHEIWDFGDGSPPVRTRSSPVRVLADGKAGVHDEDGYAAATHTYEEPGHYLVTVERTDENGYTATAHLHVPVGAGR